MKQLKRNISMLLGIILCFTLCPASLVSADSTSGDIINQTFDALTLGVQPTPTAHWYNNEAATGGTNSHWVRLNGEGALTAEAHEGVPDDKYLTVAGNNRARIQLDDPIPNTGTVIVSMRVKSPSEGNTGNHNIWLSTEPVNLVETKGPNLWIEANKLRAVDGTNDMTISPSTWYHIEFKVYMDTRKYDVWCGTTEDNMTCAAAGRKFDNSKPSTEAINLQRLWFFANNANGDPLAVDDIRMYYAKEMPPHITKQDFDRLTVDTNLQPAAANWNNDESDAGGTNTTWTRLGNSGTLMAKAYENENVEDGNGANYMTMNGSRVRIQLDAAQSSNNLVTEFRVKSQATATGAQHIWLADKNATAPNNWSGKKGPEIIMKDDRITVTGGPETGDVSISPDTWYNIRMVTYLDEKTFDVWSGKSKDTMVKIAENRNYVDTTAEALEKVWFFANGTTSQTIAFDSIRLRNLSLPSATATLTSEAPGTLNLAYSFMPSQYESAEQGTTWRLTYADDAAFTTGVTLTDEGTSDNAVAFKKVYSIKAGEENKYFRLEVTPKDGNEYPGKTVYSTPIRAQGGSQGSVVIVDNEDSTGYSEALSPSGKLNWANSGSEAHILIGTSSRYIYHITDGDRNGLVSATFTPNLEAGYYQVSMAALKADPTSPESYMTAVAHDGVVDRISIPPVDTSQWMDLGMYYFDGTGNEHVKLYSSNALRADAVKFTQIIPGDDADLLMNIHLDAGTLVERFDVESTEYNAYVSAKTYKIRPLTAPGVTVTVNGAGIEADGYSGAISNTENAVIRVTRDSESKEYTVKPVILIDTDNTAGMYEETNTEGAPWAVSQYPYFYGESVIRWPSEAEGNVWTATWNPNITEGKWVNVKIWSQNIGTAGLTGTYEIHHNNGEMATKVVDYSGAGKTSGWVDAGDFYFTGNPATEFVRANSATIDGKVRADAVLFTPLAIEDPMKISDYEFLNSNNEPITALQAGAVTAKVKAQLIMPGEAENVVMYAALYQKGTKKILHTVAMDDATVTAGGEAVTLSAAITVPENPENYDLVVYVWNKDTLVPYGSEKPL